MSSILTNNSAMVALDTLRGINKNLTSVQSEISTGKKIATSTDNAAIWSIATVMQSDVNSFSQVSDSLNLGSATVGVARAAAESVTSFLQDAKALIVAANDPSVSDADRTKYQTDIAELTKTVGSIVDAASFNGQNLLKGSGNIEVLSSLNRQEDGTVTAGKVSVARQNLSTSEAVAGSTVASTAAGGITASGTTIADDSGTATFTVEEGPITDDVNYEFTIDGNTITYSAASGASAQDIADGLKAAVDAEGITNLTTAVTASGADYVLTFTNGGADGDGDFVLGAPSVTAGGEPEGGLKALADIDVSTVAGAASALTTIDSLLQTAIDATAQFGSKQKRIDAQNEFITTLSDSLKTGIGAMTDANLEEASARLQSLQVQQQLGVQALSIANQGPQSLLALFR